MKNSRLLLILISLVILLGLVILGIHIFEDSVKATTVEEGYYELELSGEVEDSITLNESLKVRNSSESACFVRVFVKENNDKGNLKFNFAFNDKHWFNGGDGYYYYNKPIRAGKITKHLFKSIEVLNNNDEKVDISGSVVMVYTEYAKSDGHDDAYLAFRGM